MKIHLLFLLIVYFFAISFCKAQNPVLWGLSYEAGAYDGGILFCYNSYTGNKTDIHDFGSGTDGKFPVGSLIQSNNGIFYGVTNNGGVNGEGTIFSYDISSGRYTKLHDFGNDVDGQTPKGSLIQAKNGLLYGVTYSGGTNDEGTIFCYNISTGNYTKLYDFGKHTDGALPYNIFNQTNELIYGETEAGGVYDKGTIFSYDISTGIETDVQNFGNSQISNTYVQECLDCR